MKKVSILATATSAAITMALSFALVACGDDTASTAPDQPIADGESSSSDMDLPESSSSFVPDPLSSAVEESSSSIDLLQSSSSVGPQPQDSVIWTKNVDAQCPSHESNGSDADSASNDLIAKPVFESVEDRRVGPDALTPIAIVKTADDINSLFFTLPNVSMECGAIVDSVSVVVKGDTLFATPVFKETEYHANCICNTKVSFSVTLDSSIDSVNAVNFDGRIFPLVQDMEDEPEEQITYAKFASRGDCRGTSVAPTRRESASGLPYADLILDAESPKVVIYDVEDYCEIDASLSQELKGDTLVVKYVDIINMSRCTCKFNQHTFIVDNANTYAKYFKFNDVVYDLQPIVGG